MLVFIKNYSYYICYIIGVIKKYKNLCYICYIVHVIEKNKYILLQYESAKYLFILIILIELKIILIKIKKFIISNVHNLYTSVQ